MAHEENFRDRSNATMGLLAVLVIVAIPLLPAVLAWMKFFSN
ncbi:hypothetical protein [Pseudidiomarina sp.]|nr:hypothetical protein [Pseudidiomarina sp.]MDX1705137.1 hypothetical protein [Pseudidiomarina sp.]